jgi:diguanylate cyclase (GGDEF)-like protein
MARRNGRGSKSLAETITQFERSELRLLKSASRAQVLSEREVERLENRFTQSSSQKRSSDVLSAAIHFNKLLASALRESPAGDTTTSRSEFEVLTEMGTALRTEARPAEALIRFLELLGELVPFDRATVFVFDSHHTRLEPLAVIGDRVDLIKGVEFDLGSGFSSWVAKRRKATLLTDLQRPARDGEIPLRCFMSVPVVVHGDLVGVLNLGHREPRALDDDHLRLTATLASVVGATLTREVAERMLAEKAATDPLTGALTEKQLARRVYQETDRSRRYGDPLTMALVKVVDFPAFVEAHGLATGEAALKDLGRVLGSNVRCADAVGRVATDEFALLLVHTTAVEAHAIVERAAEAVARHSFPRRKRLKVDYTLAAFPEGGDELSELPAWPRFTPRPRGLRAPRGLRSIPMVEASPGRVLNPSPAEVSEA